MWQPIETAPKNGTEVIGMIRPKVIRLVWWFAPSSRTFGWRDENGREVKPLYWMPFPQLEQEANGKTGGTTDS